MFSEYYKTCQTVRRVALSAEKKAGTWMRCCAIHKPIEFISYMRASKMYFSITLKIYVRNLIL